MKATIEIITCLAQINGISFDEAAQRIYYLYENEKAAVAAATR